MQSANSDPLLLTGKVLTILMQIFMGIAFFAIMIALPALFFFGGDIAAAAASEFPDATSVFPVTALYGVLALGMLIIALVFLFFDKLRQIINTVGKGDPFAPANADRLSHMGWLMLGVQALLLPAAGLGLLIAKWADEAENANVTIDAGLDLEGVLLVILLFILARVFRHGAAMREDLEGTV